MYYYVILKIAFALSLKTKSNYCLVLTIIQEENLSKWKRLKEISKRFASESTVIGLTRISKAKTKLIQICWLLMTLVSLAFGLYLTCGTTKDYLEFDVFTQTKIIQATSSLMPSLTFLFTNSSSKDLNSLFEKAEFSTPRGSKRNLSGEQFSDKNFGDCIKFNHFSKGSGHKLVTANTLQDQFYFKINLNRAEFESVQVFLSDNYDNMLDWSQYVTTSYNVKGSYEIDLRKEVEIRLEEPYNRCRNVSDVTYRQTNCLAQCRNRNFASRYNCTLGNFYSIPGYRICEEGVSNSSEFGSKCNKECFKECTSTKFYALLNVPDLGSNISGTLEFFVEFLDLSYTEIRQTPKMSGYSLLNEIGGALGLFVGVTFLSLFEFLEFLFEIFLVFI